MLQFKMNSVKVAFDIQRYQASLPPNLFFKSLIFSSYSTVTWWLRSHFRTCEVLAAHSLLEWGCKEFDGCWGVCCFLKVVWFYHLVSSTFNSWLSMFVSEKNTAPTITMKIDRILGGLKICILGGIWCSLTCPLQRHLESISITNHTS